jgi:hypothetical protein
MCMYLHYVCIYTRRVYTCTMYRYSVSFPRLEYCNTALICTAQLVIAAAAAGADNALRALCLEH